MLITPLICSYDISVSFWYSWVLYTSQELQVVEKAENGIFAAVFPKIQYILAQKGAIQKKEYPNHKLQPFSKWLQEKQND